MAIIKKSTNREFPGGLVVRILGFTAVARVQSLVGKLRSHKPHSKAKEKPKKSLNNKCWRRCGQRGTLILLVAK